MRWNMNSAVWNKWYAWFPVEIEYSRDKVWLESIYRRKRGNRYIYIDDFGLLQNDRIESESDKVTMDSMKQQLSPPRRL